MMGVMGSGAVCVVRSLEGVLVEVTSFPGLKMGRLRSLLLAVGVFEAPSWFFLDNGS